VCALLVASAAAGQPEEQAAEAPAVVEAPVFVPVPLVAARSEDLREALRRTQEDLAKSLDEAAIDERLPKAREVLAKEAAATADLLAGSPNVDQLADQERAWANRQAELAIWRGTLAKRAADIESELSSLDSLRELWEKTLAEARRTQAPADVIGSITANLDSIASTRKLVKAFRSELLSLLNGVAQEELRASESLSAVSAKRATIRAHIFEPDGEPLWEALARVDSETSMPGRVSAGIVADTRELAAFRITRRPSLLPLAIAFGVALLAALFVRARLRDGKSSEEVVGSAMVFERPYSIAAIATFLVGVVAFPFAPSFALDIAGTALVIPILRVVRPLVHDAFRPLLYIVAAFYLMDRVRDLVDGDLLLERMLFLLQTIAGAAVMLWLLRPSRLRYLPADGARPPAVLAPVLRFSAALLGGSALANVLGYTALSRILGEGVLSTAYLTVLFYAAFRISMTVLLVAFSSARVQRLNLIQAHGPLLLRVLRGGFAVGLGGSWVFAVLENFTARRQILAAASAVLGAELTFGTFSISLGGVIGFAVTALAAVVLSRSLRVLLDGDLLPRLSMNPGIANAVSTSAYYVVLIGGLFLALGALGIDLSRFTILAGALGVGIGFGLQNVVNNFVSGLILLFERPVEVGDTIEVGGLLGDVKKIGTRASTVRTFQGAEVIVPNGNLISNEVINWTLSDLHRRIELPVGVAYGNRPADVIGVLERVFENDPRILREPAPVVLFRGFGDSSLDFEVRFWARDAASYLQVTSDVACTIYDVLKEAGIVIPFPQRDLHVKSILSAPSASANPSDPPEGQPPSRVLKNLWLSW
jgi:small-conductance mechanosensitive channel